MTLTDALTKKCAQLQATLDARPDPTLVLIVIQELNKELTELRAENKMLAGICTKLSAELSLTNSETSIRIEAPNE